MEPGLARASRHRPLSPPLERAPTPAALPPPSPASVAARDPLLLVGDLLVLLPDVDPLHPTLQSPPPAGDLLVLLPSLWSVTAPRQASTSTRRRRGSASRRPRMELGRAARPPRRGLDAPASSSGPPRGNDLAHGCRPSPPLPVAPLNLARTAPDGVSPVALSLKCASEILSECSCCRS